jgi:hypothetical protein
MPSNSTLIGSFILIAFAAMALVLWASQRDAGEDGLLIAVFPPTASERTIIEAVVAANGTYVRSSLPESIVVAHSTQEGFAERLKAQGAWLTYAQAPFGPELGGCLVLASVPFERAEMSTR